MKIELIPTNLHEELGKIPLEYDKEKFDRSIAEKIWMTLVALFSGLGILDSDFSLRPFIESRDAQIRKGLAGSTVYDQAIGDLALGSVARIKDLNCATSAAVLQYFKLRTIMMETVSGNVAYVDIMGALARDHNGIAQTIASPVCNAYESPVRRLTDLITLTRTLVNSEVTAYLKPWFYFISPANQLVLDEMKRWERNMVSLQDRAVTARVIGESREL